nr:unnamed protein product [Digitaria exilis]
MADGGRMKGVEGAGGGAVDEEERNEEVRVEEELELALSLGRRGWHLPVRQGPALRFVNWTAVLPEWNPDVAGSSRAAEGASSGQPIPSLGFHDMFGGILDPPRAVGSVEALWDNLDEEDEDRDLQNKRLRVRRFGEESPQHSGSSATRFGSESSFLPIPDENVHFKMSRFPEHELEFGLSLFPNDGGSESPKGANNELIDAENSGGINSEDVGIKMDFSDDLLHLIFSFLGQKDLCRAGVTCKQWRSASVHADFWKCLIFENTRISLQNFVDICHRYQNVYVCSYLSRLSNICFSPLSRCSQLQILSLRRTSMAHVSLNCPQLLELDFQACHKLSDTAIRQAATACPLLTKLDMSSCSCVTDETLREIASSCPNISVLDASNCPNISFEALQLDNCSLLTSVSLDLPNLKNISLVHLRKFADLNLRSPVLSYIKVSRCSALHRVSITSTALQKLVLQKQESLSSLTLQCHNLIDVDLSDCESLTNAICEVFSDGGGCPMLRSLILDNCESLSIVELNSSSLVSLSLAGCRSMTFLRLSCPNLQNVNLDGCDHLQSAAFCPVGLESLNLGICPKLSILRVEAPNMTILELKGCGCAALPKVLVYIINLYLLFLYSLSLYMFRQLVDDSLCRMAEACPLIEHLILSSCLSISIDGLSSLHCLHKLSLLDLSYTFLINLKPIFDSCPQLKVLKLSACKYLSDSSLDALYREAALPLLVELDLSYSSIGQTAIEDLLTCCTNLVNVNLNGCTNLQELVCESDGCRSVDMPVDFCPPNSAPVKNEISEQSGRLLEVLNCTGCPNIKKVVIPSMANFLQLSKINLNLSTNLKEVDLMCSNLHSLNLR